MNINNSDNNSNKSNNNKNNIHCLKSSKEDKQKSKRLSRNTGKKAMNEKVKNELKETPKQSRTNKRELDSNNEDKETLVPEKRLKSEVTISGSSSTTNNNKNSYKNNNNSNDVDSLMSSSSSSISSRTKRKSGPGLKDRILNLISPKKRKENKRSHEVLKQISKKNSKKATTNSTTNTNNLTQSQSNNFNTPSTANTTRATNLNTINVENFRNNYRSNINSSLSRRVLIGPIIVSGPVRGAPLIQVLSTSNHDLRGGRITVRTSINSNRNLNPGIINTSSQLNTTHSTTTSTTPLTTSSTTPSTTTPSTTTTTTSTTPSNTSTANPFASFTNINSISPFYLVYHTRYRNPNTYTFSERSTTTPSTRSSTTPIIRDPLNRTPITITSNSNNSNINGIENIFNPLRNIFGGQIIFITDGSTTNYANSQSDYIPIQVRFSIPLNGNAPLMLYEDLLRLEEILGQVRARNASVADLQRDHSLYIYDAKNKILVLKEDSKEKTTSKEVKTDINFKNSNKNDTFIDNASSSSSILNEKVSNVKEEKIKSEKQKNKEETAPTFGDNKTVDIKNLLGSTGTQCIICLCEYEDQDELRVLHCKHAFHKQCIDQWISKYVNNCPVCRGDGVKRENTNSNTINLNNNNNNNFTNGRSNNSNNNNENNTSTFGRSNINHPRINTNIHININTNGVQNINRNTESNHRFNINNSNNNSRGMSFSSNNSDYLNSEFFNLMQPSILSSTNITFDPENFIRSSSQIK
ncbi:hypothetical protein LY90DRAFT_503161 [Neocallimastix californiae]|uniref:RING-type domain-containing protein n=1 Tax=Neocallimastix californiae TaxID=1754190 RepID=A0A1Y2EP65_9FUNG|nr:hypothetical protein LY90DRAFT_503161 [Neocallimastix californiae]|eukprot:ORY73308.1 hypothetical protein LY90DRAFT_503161 [Neocallimastix californiae]